MRPGHEDGFVSRPTATEQSGVEGEPGPSATTTLSGQIKRALSQRAGKLAPIERDNPEWRDLADELLK